MYQNPSFIRQSSRIPIRIANRNRCNTKIVFGSKCSAITDRRSCRKILHISHMTLQLHRRLQFHNVPLHFIGRINTIDRNSRTDQVQVCLWHTNDSRTVRAMLQRNLYSRLFQKVSKRKITFQLFYCRSFIRLICPREVCKHTFNLNIWKCGDLFDLLNAFRLICKSNTAHSGIQCNVDMHLSALADCLIRKDFCHIILTDRQAHIFSDQFLEILFKNKSENQYRFLNPGIFQLNRFLCCRGRKSPDVLIVFYKTRNRFCTMSITIGLDNSYDPGTICNVFLHFLKVMSNGIQ